MGTVTTMPIVTATSVAQALANSTLSRASVAIKKGREKVGTRWLGYVDFEDPRRIGETTRLYIEPQT